MATTTPATKKATTAVLPKEVFAVEVKNHELLKLAYEAYLANGRPNLAKTLRRGEVSGGGRKPWKQKGTGRARFGSTRNPIWRTGGVVFGPLGNENYAKIVPKNAKRVALRQALTLAAQADKILISDALKPTGKTKDMSEQLAKLGATRRVIIAVTDKTPELLRATGNLQNVTVMQATYLNVYHIMNADKIIVTKDALAAITAWLGGEK
ncbi:MAG TPA: 50S ribosomal protein L4 [Candidatus Saccharimonadales bacterium]|nr:50S ribosomal protein L4 [Candidatus Saccharimonadales bacterium]